MKGYEYPGTSPVKGKRKEARKAAAKASADDAMAAMEEQLGKEYKSSSILTPSKPGPPKKGSPAKKFEINWGDVATDVIGGLATEAVKGGIGALTKGRKKPTKDNAAGGTMNTKFGGSSKIT